MRLVVLSAKDHGSIQFLLSQRGEDSSGSPLPLPTAKPLTLAEREEHLARNRFRVCRFVR